MSEGTQRRLSAIVAADVVGYAALMERDEADTLSRLFALRTQLVEPQVAERGGRIVKTTGDGILAEFPSVVDAVASAVAVQEGLRAWPDIGEPLQLRIGIHLGDVAVRDGDIFGDAVNVAARLEQAAEPGGILISGTAREQLAGHGDWGFAASGELRLKNIARPVPAWHWQPRAGDGTPVAAAQTTKPSIAVLPFDNMSGDPEQDYFADGMVEDLITMLSRFHWFRVIARNSSFAFRGQSVDVGEIGTRLGARYVLEGSVRRAGQRIRVTAQLIDTESHAHLWAERFDRVLEDIFDLQDEIVQSIVGAVVPQFVASFRAGRPAGPRTSVSSWDLAMRGWNVAWRRAGSAEAMAEARALFERALAEDGENTLAHCGLAFSYGNPYYQIGVERDGPRAMAAARRAVESDDQDAFAWCLLGAAEIWRNNLDDAERHLRRAIAINGSLALAHGYMAMIACWRADSAETDRWVARMRELSPADPMLPFVTVTRSMARFGEGDYAGAVEKIDETIAMMPELPTTWRLRAAALEMQGDHEGAAAAIERLLALGPVGLAWIRRNVTPFVDPVAWETYVDALRRAGVPE